MSLDHWLYEFQVWQPQILFFSPLSLPGHIAEEFRTQKIALQDDSMPHIRYLDIRSPAVM
jgi:hypothetical protein